MPKHIITICYKSEDGKRILKDRTEWQEHRAVLEEKCQLVAKSGFEQRDATGLHSVWIPVHRVVNVALDWEEPDA